MRKTSFLHVLFSTLLIAAALIVPYRQAEAAPPGTYQEFKARYQQEARTPEGALKMYFVAVFSYIDESTRAEGSKMLRYAMHVDRPLEESPNYVTFLERLRDKDENHVFRSFAAGSSPENNYRMSIDDFELMIVRQTEEADYLRVLLSSSGADSPRSVWVKEYDGLWYTINNSGTYLRVRAPRDVIEKRRNAHDADYDNVPSK